MAYHHSFLHLFGKSAKYMILPITICHDKYEKNMKTECHVKIYKVNIINNNNTHTHTQNVKANVKASSKQISCVLPHPR